ncbi:MAG: flagellar motor switch protein FliG [Calditrichia bacterium]
MNIPSLKKFDSTKNLSGKKKAAILMISLDVETAAAIFQHLEQPEIEKIAIEIANTKGIHSQLAFDVMEEYHQLIVAQEFITQGGMEFAQNTLEKAFGPQRAMEIIEKIKGALQVRGFNTLKKADAHQLVNFLIKEHPQTIALILSHLNAEKVADVLAEFPDDLRTEVAYRIATLGKISPELLKRVESVVDTLAEQVIGQELSSTGGAKALAEILNKASKTAEKTILSDLESRDPELAQEIKGLMFTFEDIAMIDDRGIQKILKNVDKKDLALALKASDEALKEKIFRNMSERAATLLREDLEFLGPVRLKEVEEAQRRIVEIVKQLEDEGEIVVAGRGGEEEIIV